MTKILFVCHGNICRSPMAEFIMKELVRRKGMSERFYIDSAGCSNEEQGNDMYPPAKKKLKEKGIPFEFHPARKITKRDYQLFDLILVMDDMNQKMIKRSIPYNPEHKIHRLLDRSVADPWYTDDFETCYEDILQGCENWLEKVLEPGWNQ